MRNNADQVATALQGADYTTSDTTTAIDCYQAVWESPKFRAKGQTQQVHCAFVCDFWLLSYMRCMGILALAKRWQLSLLCQCCTK